MRKKRWKIPYSRPEIPQVLVDAGYSPLLAASLALRGVRSPAEADALVHGGIECLLDPMGIKGMEAAVKRIHEAVLRGEKVAVYGDYDVDGITSTCLVTDYLISKGLSCIPYIPDRSEEGYGLNCSALEQLKEQGVSLVITVDCGITAVAEAQYAKSIGIDMIITDHHECKTGALPDAVALIDCKQDGDTYPNKNLAGVGVALKLVCACEGDAEEMLRRYSDLVAVGTVADVMPLVGENRYLVRRGLKKLEESPRAGIAAMLKECSIEPKNITAATIGYSLAPRLNAAGRLGRATMAAKLLMDESMVSACQLAAELCDLNRQRQAIENDIWQEAKQLIEGTSPDAPIVLASDSWHQGVIGIAASRLAEHFSLPAIMICLNGEKGKGSCRSYGGFNLFEALSACSKHLTGFGGHALAAGLNIERSKVDDFRRALAEYYRSNRPEPQPEVQCDILITDPSMLNIDSVRSLDMLEPYGNCNPKPIMCMSGVELEQAGDVGGGKHLKIRVRLGSTRFDGIYFSHTAKELGLREGQKVDIAFTPQINEFRGNVSVQLLLCAARPHDPSELCEAILSGDESCYFAASAYMPQREHFVKIWKTQLKNSFRTGGSLDEVLSSCPPYMSAERYCLCLMAFLETGLLRSSDGKIYNAFPNEIEGKADLEATRILKLLRSV